MPRQLCSALRESWSAATGMPCTLECPRGLRKVRHRGARRNFSGDKIAALAHLHSRFPHARNCRMKIPSLLLAVSCCFALPLRAEVSPVNMSVELVNNKTTPKGSGKTLDMHDKTQSRSLKITVNNNSPTAFDG